jgi:dephospho-CoA kinase
MKIIGLTGGIGSGKSTVLELFKEQGIATYTADTEAKNLMNSDPELMNEIRSLFGEEAYIDQKLNRTYIASIVFKDPAKLKALNNLVHPKVHQHFNNFIQNVDSEWVIYEAAILFESGRAEMCDYIIVVVADKQDRIERIIKRDGLSRAQILDRMKNQLDDTSKIKNADFVIHNKELSNTKRQILEIMDTIK